MKLQAHSGVEGRCRINNPRGRKIIERLRSASNLRKDFVNALRNDPSQPEQEAAAIPIQEYLHEFLKAESAGSAHPAPCFDWEGNEQRQCRQTRSYPLLGTLAWPDAAVLRPFRCAFEFDREDPSGGADFKTKLMKASVHVLSGNYEACVFVYFLQPRDTQHGYLDYRNKYTRRLIEALRANGMYVAMVRNRSV